MNMMIFTPTYSPAESRRELDALNRASAEILASPDLTRKFLKALGFEKRVKSDRNGDSKKSLDKRSHQ